MAALGRKVWIGASDRPFVCKEENQMTQCVCVRGSGEDGFTEEQWKQVDEIISKYREKPGALIPVLEDVQSVTGYLPESIQ